MKETRRIIIDKEQQTLTGRAVVGAVTDDLKERFKEGSIPLQTDFEKLIEIADVGRKAVGLAPGQEGKPGVGLQLGSGERLSVKLNNNSGLTAIDTGVSVKLKPDGGAQVDSSGISVKPGRGMEVSTEGVRIKDEFAFQKGMIMMFSGTTVPAGWAFCNGINGTPDLRNRFILGANVISENVLSSGILTGTGTSRVYDVTTQTTSLSVSIGSTNLSLANLPSHKHDGGMQFYSSQAMPYGQANSKSEGHYSLNNANQSVNNIMNTSQNDVYRPYTSSVGSGTGHTHSATISQPIHTHIVNVLPPYYTLAFIMKL
ncbi:hypothetical protein RDT67_19095 [Serratia fonticola]|uniref:Phage tail collar domain-containing protein n=1 Tax=Serratia fonticola TaxID=47917 RepID=A0AAJ2D8Q3_SERFO|nr:tail fiber protein [Serratia fonticola]MDQ9128527.1 hypothetical protein [Serratia fonticola]